MLAALLVLGCSREALAQRTTLETDDLRLIYLDPTQTYLAPHVARCFQNALAFHREEYDPGQRMTARALFPG